MDIPAAPQAAYKEKGWVNLGDWLGTGFIARRDRKYLPFIEARAYVRGLGLKSQKEWLAFTKSPTFPNIIPADPRPFYKDEGWIGMLDWSGINLTEKTKVYPPFDEAHAIVRSLKIRNIYKWRSWARSEKRPKDIPVYPREVYKGRTEEEPYASDGYSQRAKQDIQRNWVEWMEGLAGEREEVAPIRRLIASKQPIAT